MKTDVGNFNYNGAGCPISQHSVHNQFKDLIENHGVRWEHSGTLQLWVYEIYNNVNKSDYHKH